ncbi:hypothetical protein D9611_012211 [Ephemerocybe angulata]|uniref:ATP-dependent DNA helicase n=1 Tax=Ephemerocybe angulata TaxID=980116 RepID=A0A8H5C5L5_9AGAR|nr:hypothetical protein D9611_012211 [Tulosesus angulatus]
MRCNMDIKFVGSGEDAKAVIYYITNYITKTQLKTHVAYAALELATRKLGEYNPKEDDITVRAKRLLQKCAYSILSHQELSGQQVASYLMDYGDHYTSHKYQQLFWTSFENFIEREQPSPECAPGGFVPSSRWNRVSEDGQLELSSEGSVSDSDSDTNSEADLYDSRNDEVTISRDPNSGHLIAKVQQVVDYQLRPEEIGYMNVWDYIKVAQKVPAQKDDEALSEDGNELDLGEDDAQGTTEEEVSTLFARIFSDSSSDKRNGSKRRGPKPNPRYQFLPNHPEHRYSEIKLRCGKDARVPVPIGPALPRRDCPEVYERYCRLMLILFKPWRHAEDLRSGTQKWSEAFSEFQNTCDPQYLAIMRNMQILHECKDSGNDHFERMRMIRRSRRSHNSAARVTDDFGPEDVDEMLNHIRSIAMSSSAHAIAQRQNLGLCMDYVDDLGIFTGTQEDSNMVIAESPINIVEVTPDFLQAEDIWKQTYENRRAAALKQWSSVETPNASKTRGRINEHRVNDGSTLREALEDQPQTTLEASVRRDMPIDPQNFHEKIDDIVHQFTLNTEQKRAFRIIAEHSLDPSQSQLKMYLGGAGGTGKSRVIQALTTFFNETRQSRRFRLASYTGVAAKNIEGMTIHSALCLNQRKKGTISNKAKQDLMSLWTGVDYLFIDEVSMIGCAFLAEISDALTHAKGKNVPFGGINIILAGDFAQLPPVGQVRLAVRMNARELKPTTSRGQANIAGKLLWNSIDTVVILKDVMRQAGSENANEFTDLLARLREGRSTAADYMLLNNRLIENVKPDMSQWLTAPIIVSDNLTKDALNAKAAAEFARKSGQPLHWYYTTDTHHGQPISDPELKEFLETSVGANHTQQRMGRIPLVVGMPVMICQNYDVEGGIVNGCIDEASSQGRVNGNGYT